MREGSVQRYLVSDAVDNEEFFGKRQVTGPRLILPNSRLQQDPVSLCGVDVGKASQLFVGL